MIQPAVDPRGGLLLWHLHATFKAADEPVKYVGAFLATLCAYVAEKEVAESTVCHLLRQLLHGG